MADEAYVTRREIDLLKATADVDRAKMWARIEGLDEHGSRGVQALTIRMDSMVASLAELKADVSHQFDAHHREHERDEAKRVSSRRWLIGAIIAAVAAIDGPIVTVVLARR